MILSVRLKVFVTRQIPQEGLDLLNSFAEVKVWSRELPPPQPMLIEEVKDIDGLLCLLTDKIDTEVMARALQLRVISIMAVGYDNIDVTEATKQGIIVGYTPGVLTETTADFAFALLLAAARRVVEADGYTRKGKWITWGPMVLLGQDVHHATLGLVGLGRIGLEVAKRAKGFDMHVLYHTRRRREEEERRFNLEYALDLPTLLSRSDFVSLHVPLTDETKHLIGPKEFALMKPTAILINTSRGVIVDQKALYEALSSGRIAGAAIDVTEEEPIPLNDPLLTLDNIIITPHIASASNKTRIKMAIMAAENLIAGLKGELPPNCVNPEAWRGMGSHPLPKG